MKKFSKILVFIFVGLLVGNLGIADVGETISEMGIESSNVILETMEEAYDDLDYDLFEICALKVFELELEESLSFFSDVFQTCNPDANEYEATLQATLKPFFYVSVLAYGHFGDDTEVGQLLTAMIRNDDDHVTWYIFKALGYMTESERALNILNEATGWVDSVLLAEQLIESLEAHADYSSIVPLSDLLENPRLKGLKDEVNEAIDTIVSVQVY